MNLSIISPFWDITLGIIILGAFLYFAFLRKRTTVEDGSNGSTTIQVFEEPVESTTPTRIPEDPALVQVSQYLEMPLSELKVILGIPLRAECNAETYAAAEDIYFNAEPDSDEEYVAVWRMIELAETLDKLDEIWNNEASDSLSLSEFINQRKLAIARIELAAARSLSGDKALQRLKKLFFVLYTPNLDKEIVQHMYDIYRAKNVVV